MTNYKTKTDEDITKIIAEKRQALRSFRFALSGSKTRNVREGRAHRKEIARALTELTRRGASQK